MPTLSVIQREKVKLLVKHEQEHLKKLQGNEDYWGSEDDINTGNEIANEISFIVGFEITEDNVWVSETIKATAEEICQYNCMRLNQLLEC
jgi:hypothetical protein